MLPTQLLVPLFDKPVQAGEAHSRRHLHSGCHRNSQPTAYAVYSI